jgi:hypothetical protein
MVTQFIHRICIISLLCCCQLGCKKTVEVEKVVYTEKSDIRVVQYPGDSFSIRLRANSDPKDQNDTVIFKELDIDNDNIKDLRAGIELYHIDTSVYFKVFIRRINPDCELLGYDDDIGRVLTSFSDTNNYIVPNTDQWKYAFNTDEYLISVYSIYKCMFNGIPSFCLLDKRGNFIDGKSRYFFGFRMKNEKSNGGERFWNYGYFKIKTIGEYLSIQKMAIENVIDKPILLRE